MRALLLAASMASGFGTLNDDDWPPSRFRSVGTTIVTFASKQHDIDRLCGKAPRGLTTEACTTARGMVVLPDPCGYQGEFARIVCHENAHRFGGWPENHPR